MGCGESKSVPTKQAPVANPKAGSFSTPQATQGSKQPASSTVGPEPDTAVQRSAGAPATDNHPSGGEDDAANRCSTPAGQGIRHSSGAQQSPASPSLAAVEMDVDVRDIHHSPSMRLLKGAQLWSAAANKYPDSAKVLYKAAMSLGPGEQLTLTRIPKNLRLTKRQALVEAARMNSGLAAPCIALGNDLRNGETIKMADGRKLARIDLYLEAVRREPTNAVTWYSLGNATPLDTPTALLPSVDESNAGSAAPCTVVTVTKLSCLGMAISLDEALVAPVKLAARLTQQAPGSYVQIPNGGPRLNHRDLLVRLVSLEPAATLYLELAEALPATEVVTLLNSTSPLSSKDLYAKCLDLDENASAAYRGLIPLLGDDEQLCLPQSGRTVTKRTCCAKIIELDPAHSGLAYATLSRILPSDEPLVLADGKSLTQRTASLAALKAAPWTGGDAAGPVHSASQGAGEAAGPVVDSRVSSDSDEQLDSEDEDVVPYA